MTSAGQTVSDRQRLPLWRMPIRGVLLILLAGITAWSAAALWFDGPSARWLAGLLAATLVLGCAAPLILLKPFRRAVFAVLGAFLIVLVWWLSIAPRNDRDWSPDVAQLPSALIAGDKVTLRNIRNFAYRSETDFTERWETRTYNISQVVDFDMFFSYWGPTLIAHTIASWEFADGRHLAVSIETRKEKGETYSALRGFFRQFELYYVVADERDVIGLRAKHRGEQVFLYRLTHPPEQARAMLLAYLREINSLAAAPRWYNALTHNCTTAIRYHAQEVGVARPLHWKLFANGYLDELGYERGMIDTSLPFPELKRRSDITEKAKAADGDADFSRRIREGLPMPRPQ